MPSPNLLFYQSMRQIKPFLFLPVGDLTLSMGLKCYVQGKIVFHIVSSAAYFLLCMKYSGKWLH
jgi:hypothetical protein